MPLTGGPGDPQHRGRAANDHARAGRTPGNTVKPSEDTMANDDTDQQALLKRILDEEIKRMVDEEIQKVWDRPDPNVVKLQDGRQVAREFYDPLLHGKPAD
jgi:hypothetical protein